MITWTGTWFMWHTHSRFFSSPHLLTVSPKCGALFVCLTTLAVDVVVFSDIAHVLPFHANAILTTSYTTIHTHTKPRSDTFRHVSCVLEGMNNTSYCTTISHITTKWMHLWVWRRHRDVNVAVDQRVFDGEACDRSENDQTKSRNLRWMRRTDERGNETFPKRA